MRSTRRRISRTRQGRRLDLRHASGDRAARQPASCRPEDQGRTLFRLRRDRHLRADGDHREGEAGDEAGANAEVEIYPGTHHGFAFPKRPVYDRDAAERHWERLLALYRRNLVGLEPPAMPFLAHRLSGVRSDRDLDRADRDPLVCAGLYLRHRAGLDLCARADQERKAVGRAGADHAAAARRFHPLGHDRHHPRRPHRLRAVLQSAVLHRSIPPRSSNCGRAACRSMAASSAASPR